MRILKTFPGRFVTMAAGTSPVVGATVKLDRMTSPIGIFIPRRLDSATGEWNIYIDGVSESSMTINKDPIDADDGPLFIGRDTCCDGRFGNAIIDEVAIFNVALGEDDIQMMMDQGLSAMLLTPVETEDKLSTTWGKVKEQY